MSKYRGIQIEKTTNPLYKDNKTIITPLEIIFIKIALMDFHFTIEDVLDENGDEYKSSSNVNIKTKTCVLPNYNKSGNTSWMNVNVIDQLAKANSKMDEAFQKVDQRLSMLYKGFRKSVAERPTTALVSGTTRRVGNDISDEPSVTECMFNYRIRSAITLYLLMKLCEKNNIKTKNLKIGKMKLYNSRRLEQLANSSWLLKIYKKQEKKFQKKKKKLKILETT